MKEILLKLKSKFALSRRGMTLIEVLMSLAVFAVLMTAAASSILGSIDANQKAQSINSVMSNLTVALESMSRDIRVGSEYSFDENQVQLDNGSHNELFYTDDHDVRKRIRLDSNGVIQVQDLSVVGSSEIPLTATEVHVENLTFSIFLEDDTDGPPRQPAIRIRVKGEVNVQDRTATEFYLQTFVSQRLFNSES